MTPALLTVARRSVIEIIETNNIRLPEAPGTGRPRIIEWVDAVTLGVYQHLSTRSTKKSVWSDFKKTLRCAYSTFVTALNDAGEFVLQILGSLMRSNREVAHVVKYTDATDILVCLNKNATTNRTMRESAATWSHSGKGFYYGLKMTMTRDAEGRLLALKFTGATANDRTIFRSINKRIGGIIVADAGYVDKGMEKEMSIPGRVLIIKPYKTMRRAAAAWQTAVYNSRFQIEFDFRNLKLFHGLENHFVRSLNGGFANIIFAMLSFVLV